MSQNMLRGGSLPARSGLLRAAFLGWSGSWQRYAVGCLMVLGSGKTGS
jgi:hypothetical protein